jgi:hypothetical protein
MPLEKYPVNVDEDGDMAEDGDVAGDVVGDVAGDLVGDETGEVDDYVTPLEVVLEL